MKDPEIYQIHRVCLKYTVKGKRSQTIVALSNSKLYLFGAQGKNESVPKLLLGSCLLSGIKNIVTHSNCDTLITVVASSSLLGGSGKIDVNLILRFYNVPDTKWL